MTESTAGRAELFAGRYGFVDLLGSGGMGTVWRVWDARRGEYSAAKVLSRADSTSLLRFIRESSWRVEHDHVLTPTGWAAEDDRVLFTMPLVRGGTVADLVRDFGALPGALAADLVGQLLEALVAVHRAGLVHRDLKPSNLLLDPPGSARPRLLLSDFGIAAHVDDPRLTRMGEAVGTRGYAAPEVLAGADPHPAQDVFAVGVLLAELVTGQRPPAAAPPPGHPLRPLIDALRAEDPAERPDAVEALARLRRLAPDGGDRAASEPADQGVEVFDHVPDLPEGWGADGPHREDRVEPMPPEPAAAGPATGPDRTTAPLPPRAAGSDDGGTERLRTSTTAPLAAPFAAGPPRPQPAARRSAAPAVVVVVVLLLAGGGLLALGSLLVR